jgi:hypothetical protein
MARPITCYAGLEVIADADQVAVESGIILKDKFATAKFLQAIFAQANRTDAFDERCEERRNTPNTEAA